MPAATLAALLDFRSQLIAHFAGLLDTAGLPNVCQRYGAEDERTPEIVVDARVREQTRTERFVASGTYAGRQVAPHYRGLVTVLITANRRPDTDEVSMLSLESRVRATMALISEGSLPSLSTIQLVWWREGPSLDASEILFGSRQASMSGFKDDVTLLQWECEWIIRPSEWPA